jgi:hypothetical protein
MSELSLEPAIEGRFDESIYDCPQRSRQKYVDIFFGRQTLIRTGGGALCIGADGPRLGAGRSVTWRRARVSYLTAGRSVRAQGRRKSPAAPGSRSREGLRRGGEILGNV